MCSCHMTSTYQGPRKNETGKKKKNRKRNRTRKKETVQQPLKGSQTGIVETLRGPAQSDRSQDLPVRLSESSTQRASPQGTHYLAGSLARQSEGFDFMFVLFFQFFVRLFVLFFYLNICFRNIINIYI